MFSMTQHNTLQIPTERYIERSIPSDMAGVVNSFLEIFGNADLKRKQIPLGRLNEFHFSDNTSLLVKRHINQDTEARLKDHIASGYWKRLLKRNSWLVEVNRDDLLGDEVIFEVHAADLIDLFREDNLQDTVHSIVMDLYIFRQSSTRTTYMRIERGMFHNPSERLVEDANAFRARFLELWGFDDVRETAIGMTTPNKEPTSTASAVEATDWLQMFEERPEAVEHSLNQTIADKPEPVGLISEVHQAHLKVEATGRAASVPRLPENSNPLFFRFR